MSAQLQVVDGTNSKGAYSASQAMPERAAWHLPGVPVLVLDVVLLAAAIVSFWQASQHTDGAKTGLVWTGAVLLAATILVFRGLTPVAPGRAHVIQLFGRYQGTVRDQGLQWVNPFATRIAVSTRIRNLESSLS